MAPVTAESARGVGQRTRETVGEEQEEKKRGEQPKKRHPTRANRHSSPVHTRIDNARGYHLAPICVSCRVIVDN